MTANVNPKDLVGSLKVGLGYLSPRVLYESALALLEGALKYGKHNFRCIPVRASVYYDATKRHLDCWYEGEDIDPDSKQLKINHITKAIASLMVLRDAMIRGNWTDDRPPRSEDGWMIELNDRAKMMIEACENPKAPYTQKGEEARAVAEQVAAQFSVKQDAISEFAMVAAKTADAAAGAGRKPLGKSSYKRRR